MTNVVLAVAAVVVVVLLVRQGDSNRRATQGSPTIRTAQLSSSALAALHGLLPRPADGRVPVVVFVDVECPYCARYQETVARVTAELSSVSVEFAHFPLPQHRFARGGAVALECAREQGRLEPMLSATYASRDSLGLLAWSEVAARALLDTSSLVECVRSGRHDSTIERHLEVAHLLGVTGTPTVIAGTTRLSGSPSVDEIVAAVSAATPRR
ncbi:MAG: thioredoxin domain-containing protein [Gemmatimonadaceae bacterium]|nr:thioredoxin domain-containing protein [Gemmatimonadaceae bacterium]